MTGKLKSGLHSLAYGIEKSAEWFGTGKMVRLSQVLRKMRAISSRNMTATILNKPNYTGDYTDHLTFDIAFQDTAYNITYETNGGTITKKNPQQADQMITVTQEQYQAGTVLKDLPAPVKSPVHFLAGVTMKHAPDMWTVRTVF